MEGSRAGHARITEHARRDIPTCDHAEPAGDARRRARAVGRDVAVVCTQEGDVPDAARTQNPFLVTTSDGVRLGLVRRADLTDALRRDGKGA